jgi:hypothetical protein
LLQPGAWRVALDFLVALFQLLANLPALLRLHERRLSSLFCGCSGGTAAGLRWSSTATMVKKQLLVWRTERSRMFSVTTLMPTSIEVLPV